MREGLRRSAPALTVLACGLLCTVTLLFVASSSDRPPPARPGPDPARSDPGPKSEDSRGRAAEPVALAREDAGAAQRAPTRRPRLPGHLLQALGIAPEDAAGDHGVVTNREPIGGSSFHPDDLAALRALIRENGLTEDSSAFDWNDGDGELEPWELGFQAWRGSRLVALAFGPDPHASFGYPIVRVPPEIGRMSELRYLDLHGTKLVDLPPEVGALGQLRELYAHQTGLSHLPEEIGDLAELRVMVLSQNRLGALPEGIGRLSRLEYLELRANPLPELSPRLSALDSLRVLDVAHTRRPGEPGASLLDLVTPLPHLETLYLSDAEAGASAAQLYASIPKVYGLAGGAQPAAGRR